MVVEPVADQREREPEGPIIASPGNTACNGSVVRYSWLDAIIAPHSAVGACTPIPKKENVAIVPTAYTTSDDIYTRSCRDALGKMCRKSNRTPDMPLPLAA